MILLIDAGNTRIKWRVIPAPGEERIDEGVCVHQGIAQLQTAFDTHPGLERVLGTNVAGPGTASRIEALARPHGLVPEWLTPVAECCGVHNHYEDPSRLGADRWAALIGARRMHPHACLVVTAGTATTVDLLDAGGGFQGGLILPGMDLMLRSLATQTAQLPLAAGHYRPTPRCTADAIHSGCLLAQVGAVERMFRQIAADAQALCLLGGGAADKFAELLDLPLRRVDNLVLLGLETIAHIH